MKRLRNAIGYVASLAASTNVAFYSKTWTCVDWAGQFVHVVCF